jgi:hypothetical protein
MREKESSRSRERPKSKSVIRNSGLSASPLLSRGSLTASPLTRPTDPIPHTQIVDDPLPPASTSSSSPSTDPLSTLGISRAAAGFLGLVDDHSSHAVVRVPPPTSPATESHSRRIMASPSFSSTHSSRSTSNLRAPSPSILQSSTSTVLGSSVSVYGVHLKESQVSECALQIGNFLIASLGNEIT